MKYIPLDKLETLHTALSLFTSICKTICPITFTISISEIVSDEMIFSKLLVGLGKIDISGAIFSSMPVAEANEAMYVAFSVTVILRGLSVLPSSHDENS